MFQFSAKKTRHTCNPCNSEYGFICTNLPCFLYINNEFRKCKSSAVLVTFVEKERLIDTADDTVKQEKYSPFVSFGPTTSTNWLKFQIQPPL